MIKRILPLVLVVTLGYTSSPFTALCQSTFEKNKDGITMHFPHAASEDARTIKLSVKGDRIIQVQASPTNEIIQSKELMTIPMHSTANWNVQEKDGVVAINTSALVVEVQKATGAITFKDEKGKVLLAERRLKGRSFKTVDYSGEQDYQISQVFESPEDEALYGLGQHQDDIINYKNQHVELFQYNTKVSIPLLVSNKNYGILWDNYSYTKVGDTRNTQPLSALRLFSEKGEQGWLTAKYGSKTNETAPAIVKAESAIDYSFLKDQHKFPKDYNLADGKVIWTGAIASDQRGSHSFDIKYAGYIKIWIDGKLLTEKWRQAWNPGSAVIAIDMEQNKKYPIRIEWLPDGSESYLSVRCLSPIPESNKNTYAFESQAADAINYYFIAGKNADEVISGYRTITGKAVMLPKWAMGFWQSRERYKTQEELLSAAKELRDRKIPMDVIVQDWSYWKENEWGSQQFDPARFPNPKEMISTLHKKYDARLVISAWPKFYEGIPEYNYMNEHGWLYRRNIADQRKDWIGKGYISTFYDALNPDARKGFWNLLNKNLYSLGMDGWWMDAAEPDVHSNLDMETRQELMSPNYLGSGVKYFNAFPLGNAKGIYEGQMQTNPNARPLLLTRSAYAGQQRYATIVWSGDIASRWEDMKTQISAGVNFSLSGIPYWSMDAGGFSVERRYEKPNETDLKEWRELNTRWFQFATFIPVFRAHGQYPFREIYNIAPEGTETYNSILYYNKLRYKLMPYIYSLAGKAYHKDYTIMRGLMMDFGQDAKVLNIGDQYMFGNAFLINPVYTYGATSRTIYLPSTCNWYDLYSGKQYTGGQSITAEASYERMPVFVKEGSIVPTGPDMLFTMEKKTDPTTLFVYTGKDATFSLYEDEGLNNDYMKGVFSEIPLSYNEASQTLQIGKRKGTYKGMLSSRSFKIVWISATHPNGIDTNQQNIQTIKYQGNEVTIKKD